MSAQLATHGAAIFTVSNIGSEILRMPFSSSCSRRALGLAKQLGFFESQAPALDSCGTRFVKLLLELREIFGAVRTTAANRRDAIHERRKLA